MGCLHRWNSLSLTHQGMEASTVSAIKTGRNKMELDGFSLDRLRLYYPFGHFLVHAVRANFRSEHIWEILEKPWVSRVTACPRLLFIENSLRHGITMIRKFFHNISLGRRYLFSIFFFSILLAPSIGYVVGGHSGEFSENYFGKEKMIYYLNNSLYHVFGNRAFPGLINAGDGWLVYTGELSSDDYQNAYPFTT